MSLNNIKKGDTVILHMFTGIAVGVKEVLAANKETVTLETRAGMAKFSRKTGKQIDPPAKQDRFANFITEDDGSYQPSNAKKGKKKSKKPAKKAKPEPEEDDDEDEEDEDEEVKPAKKSSKKKSKAPAKKSSKKKPEPDEDEDFDEDEFEEEDED